jgi:hypothetical protein
LRSPGRRTVLQAIGLDEQAGFRLSGGMAEGKKRRQVPGPPGDSRKNAGYFFCLFASIIFFASSVTSTWVVPTSLITTVVV